MDDLDSLKLRYRCPECKNLESHHPIDKKRKCEKCGTVLTEITEKDYQHYKDKKKKKEEDKKEKKEKDKDKDFSKNKDKKKKKSEKKEEESPEKEDKKNKHKLKRSSSIKDIEDKNYKKKESKETSDLNSRKRKSRSKSSSKKDKKKKRNRYRSLEKLGPILNKIVSKALNGGKGVEKDLKKLNKIDFSSITDSDENNITINHSNNQPTQVLINQKDVTHIVDTDVFQPLFNTLNSVFMDNFMENFSSSSTSYYNNVQTVVNNNREHAIKNGSVPCNDECISNLKQFKLSNKYCKKGKDGNYELPSCCICLSEIKKGKETTLLPCGHMFHSKCCISWLKKNNTCPMCRYEVK